MRLVGNNPSRREICGAEIVSGGYQNVIKRMSRWLAEQWGRVEPGLAE